MTSILQIRIFDTLLEEVIIRVEILDIHTAPCIVQIMVGIPGTEMEILKKLD
jgi:hypothetical protein